MILIKFKQKKNYLTHEQHIKTIKKAWIEPATPTTHEALINKITPNIFWTHGKNTPNNVPSLAGCDFKK